MSSATSDVLIVWSAAADPKFEVRLRRAGFEASAHRVRARGRVGKGPWHVLFEARVRVHGAEERW